MKEQQETNNASPAAAVNLQMWPSAPREEGKEEWEAGRSSSAFSLPSTKPAPDVQPRTLPSCQPASAPTQGFLASPHSSGPFLYTAAQCKEGRWPLSSLILSSVPQLSRVCLTRQLPSQIASVLLSLSFPGFFFNTSQTHFARFVGLVF